MSEEVRKAWPLSWPSGWRRTPSPQRKNGRFRREGKYISVHSAVGRIRESLEKMGVNSDDILISTEVKTRLDGLPRSDQPEPADPGAAVYWKETPDSPTKCMAIDIYTTVADNLAAIAATLEAMRAIERHGGAEILNRAFTGFAALPRRASLQWREVLFDSPDEIPSIISRDVIEAAFRIESRKHHPDIGGDRDRFEAIVEARKQALQEVLG